MTKLQEYLAKKNQAPNLSLKEYIFNITNKKLEEMISDLKDEFTSQLKIEVENQVNEILSKVKDGEKGDDGYTPIKGVDYFDGKDGRDGKDGLNGIDGRDGKDGLDGMDGSPDMPQQIADKLNTLEEKVDIKVIRGLNNILRSIQGSLREKGQRSFGGGGMGNVETKSVAISSATTTITLDSSVASNGKAIWFNYQGQQQAYGVHFTVSGNVITLLFTPADNTYADIIYIRS